MRTSRARATSGCVVMYRARSARVSARSSVISPVAWSISYTSIRPVATGRLRLLVEVVRREVGCSVSAGHPSTSGGALTSGQAEKLAELGDGDSQRPAETHD